MLLYDVPMEVLAMAHRMCLIPPLTLVVGLLAAAAAPVAAAKQKPIAPSSAFKLPAATRCLAKPELRLQLKTIRGVRWKSVSLKVNGRGRTAPRAALGGKAFTLGGLPTGTVRLTITARTTKRRSATASRTYRPCAPQRAPLPAPTPPTPPTPPVPPVPAPPAPATPPAPGRYSATNYGLPFSFFISADGGEVQDVSITIDMTCTPGGSLRDEIPIGEIAIATDGSFSSTTTQQNLVGSVPATYTYTFTGRINGTSVAGTMREDVTYNDGIARSCSSGDRAFTAVRDANQGTQQAFSPGSYSASAYGLPFTFFVSPDGKHLQDIAVTLDLKCSPGGSFRDQLQLDDIAIAADGSFDGSAEQRGVIANTPATFKYTFAGHFHGTDSSGRARLAGTLREEIRYDDGIARVCFSSALPWRAVRDSSQGAAQGTLSPVPAGSYSATGYGLGFRFFVSPDGTKLQDVAITSTSTARPLGLPERDPVRRVRVRPRRLLRRHRRTGRGDRQQRGEPATASAATSTAPLQRAGTARRHRPRGRDVQQRRRPLVQHQRPRVACAPGQPGRPADARSAARRRLRGQRLRPPVRLPRRRRRHTGAERRDLDRPRLRPRLRLPAATDDGRDRDRRRRRVHRDGTKTGMVGTFPATFEFRFRGHFYGTLTNGTARVAGVTRASATYSDGTARSCTSNDLAWVALRTGAAP